MAAQTPEDLAAYARRYIVGKPHVTGVTHRAGRPCGPRIDRSRAHRGDPVIAGPWRVALASAAAPALAVRPPRPHQPRERYHPFRRRWDPGHSPARRVQRCGVGQRVSARRRAASHRRDGGNRAVPPRCLRARDAPLSRVRFSGGRWRDSARRSWSSPSRLDGARRARHVLDARLDVGGHGRSSHGAAPRLSRRSSSFGSSICPPCASATTTPMRSSTGWRTAARSRAVAIRPLAVGTEHSISAMSRATLARYLEDADRAFAVAHGDRRQRHPSARRAACRMPPSARLPVGSLSMDDPGRAAAAHRPLWWLRERALPTNYILGYFQGPPRNEPGLRRAAGSRPPRCPDSCSPRSARAAISPYAVNAPFLDRALSAGGLYVTTVAPDSVLTIMRRTHR